MVNAGDGHRLRQSSRIFLCTLRRIPDASNRQASSPQQAPYLVLEVNKVKHSLQRVALAEAAGLASAVGQAHLRAAVPISETGHLHLLCCAPVAPIPGSRQVKCRF